MTFLRREATVGEEAPISTKCVLSTEDQSLTYP